MEKQPPKQTQPTADPQGYYGTGRRPETEWKPHVALIVTLLVVLLSINLVTAVIHHTPDSPEAEDEPEDEGGRLSVALSADGSSPSDSISGGESLGMRLAVLDDAQRRYCKLPEGVIVEEVAEGASAALAGVRSGDVIVRIQGESVTDAESCTAALERCAAAQTVTLSVYRSGTYYELELEK